MDSGAATQGTEVVVKDAEYREQYGFNDKFEYKFKTEKGLSEDIVREISAMKEEPEWMLEKRLVGYKQFLAKPTPQWGGNLNEIDYNDIYYYMKPTDKKSNNWDAVPEEIKRTFDKLGIPESERKFFAGAEAQYDSEVVYSHIREDLAKEGVIFVSTDEAVKKYPELMKKYFGTVIPPTDNKFAALNTATWSGGSFIYVPKGVKLKLPLQAYFRINTEKAGQFERTLIIADEGADVTYIEGCTAPIYMSSSLHSAVVELVAHKNAHIRYVTIQNWSKNVYNLVTQRAFAYENAHVEWIDGNIGSKLNMKYPSVYLKERGARGEIMSIAVAGPGQVQDSGGKIYHLAPDTTSQIISKSVSSGRRGYHLQGASSHREQRLWCKKYRALRRFAFGRGVEDQHIPLHGGQEGGCNHNTRGQHREGRRGAAVLPHVEGHERGGCAHHDSAWLP